MNMFWIQALKAFYWRTMKKIFFLIILICISCGLFGIGFTANCYYINNYFRPPIPIPNKSIILSEELSRDFGRHLSINIVGTTTSTQDEITSIYTICDKSPNSRFISCSGRFSQDSGYSIRFTIDKNNDFIQFNATAGWEECTIIWWDD